MNLVWFGIILCACGLQGTEGMELKREESIILPPVVEQGPDVALLIVPGAFINGDKYQDLGAAIQAAFPLRLWVALVRPFAFDLPNPIQVIPDMDTALATMREMGMVDQYIFVGGHSIGGQSCQKWAWEHPENVTGLVLMASVPTQHSLTESSIPMMIISGDLDGMEVITMVWDYFRQLESSLDANAENIFYKPVVVLEDVNHMHFASGEPTPYVKENDILSPMDFETAHSHIADHVTAFMKIAMSEPAQEIGAAILLAEAHDITKQKMLPLKVVDSISAGDDKSPFIEQAQKLLANPTEEYLESILVQDLQKYNSSDLAERYPAMDLTSENKANISTVTYVHRPTYNEAAVGMKTIVESGSKFMSQGAVRELLEPLGVTFGVQTDCKTINEAAVDLAWLGANDVVRARFLKRGRPLVILEDEVLSETEWYSANLYFNDTTTDEGLLARSSSALVGSGIQATHNCWLLSPIRALEWIMVDSLRGTQP